MMTLDEAIAHAKWCSENSEGECSEEHRQLAEWLRAARGCEESGRWFTARIHDLKAENAKLRELVKAFGWCTENFDLPCKCDSCPLSQSDKLTPECEVRMRELGIEVD